MAIIKELESSFGCSASYHKTVAVSVNCATKKVVICLASFISKETRKNNCNPVEMIDINVPVEDYHFFLEKPIINAAYDWLKHNVTNFEESEDDYETFDSPSQAIELEKVEANHEK